MDAKLKYVIVAVCLLSSPVQTGAETLPKFSKKALIGSLLSKPTTIDPVKATTHSEMTLASLVFDTLYVTDSHGNAVPHLALGPPTIAGLNATIEIDTQVRFHSGQTLTADDVARSLRRLAGDRRAGWLLEPVDSISRQGDTVILKLRRATPELTKLLSSPRAAITRKGKAPRLNTSAAGTGPFKVRRVSKSRITFRRFDKHFAGPPFLAGLTLQWFTKADAEAKSYEAGETHLSQRGSVAFAGHKPKYRTRDAEGPAVILSFVGFGNNRKVFGKTKFRKAVSLAISRDALRNVGTGERVVPTIYAAAVDSRGPGTVKADRKARRVEAKKLLAGLQTGSDAIEVLVDRGRLDDQRVAKKVVSALLNVGLSAKVVEVDSKQFARKTGNGKCDLYIGQLAAVADDPSLQFASAFAAGGDRWAEKELRKGPLNLVSLTGGFEQRLPVVPLFHRAVRVHHRSNVRGAELDALSRLSYADLRVHGPSLRSKR